MQAGCLKYVYHRIFIEKSMVIYMKLYIDIYSILYLMTKLLYTEI